MMCIGAAGDQNDKGQKPGQRASTEKEMITARNAGAAADLAMTCRSVGSEEALRLSLVTQASSKQP